MPEVIDNVEVGEYIKKLLRERNMNQSDLANELHISKSAISQNLNGKSSFDIQNLIKISEIFEISLDVLLSLRTDEDRNVISEYERLIRRGLDEIKEISSEKINISIPDLYGKVFIEYVIEYDKEDVYDYLLNNNIALFQKTHSNAREVYLKIINYMIVKQKNGFTKFIIDYVKEYGSFKILNEQFEKSIITGLDSYQSPKIVNELFTIEVKHKIPFLRIFKVNQRLKVLPSKEWAKLIGKYHAEVLLNMLQESCNITDYIEDVVQYFVLYGFKKGLFIVQKSLSADQINRLRHKGNHLQNIIELISDFDDIKLFKQFINNKIYKDLTKLTIKCIKAKKKELYTYLVSTQSQYIDFRIVGLSLIGLSNIELLKNYLSYFTKDDLDFFLSKSTTNQIELNLALLDLGAKVNSKYLNRNTTDKVNNIIGFLLKKGDTK